MAILVDGDLILYGFVGDDYWGDGFTASGVIDALAELGRDADITVRINSGGGYIDDGIAIFNALSMHKGDVDIVIDAVAASSASVIAMAGTTITMRKGALMMVHEPSGGVYGTADDHKKSAEIMDMYGDVMADIYADQTGDDADDLRAEMKAELWMKGAEAVKRGFATDVGGGKAKAAAAFDYRVYAQAPQKLVALATKEKWSFDAQARKAASAVKPKAKKETPKMALKTKAADEKPAAQTEDQVTAADVKARIKAITEDDAATGHEKLARHLAFDTDHPTDEAIALLKAAASDATNASQGETSNAGDYQKDRALAADLAQPGGGNKPAPSAVTINTASIYEDRRKAAKGT